MLYFTLIRFLGQYRFLVSQATLIYVFCTTLDCLPVFQVVDERFLLRTLAVHSQLRQARAELTDRPHQD